MEGGPQDQESFLPGNRTSTRPRIEGPWPSAVNDCGNKHYAQTGMSVSQLVSRSNGQMDKWTNGQMDERTNGQLDRQWEKQTGGHPVSLSFLVSVKLGWTLGISRLPLDLCPLPSVLCPLHSDSSSTICFDGSSDCSGWILIKIVNWFGQRKVNKLWQRLSLFAFQTHRPTPLK